MAEAPDCFNVDWHLYASFNRQNATARWRLLNPSQGVVQSGTQEPYSRTTYLAHFSIAGLQLSISADDNLLRLEREVNLLMARFPWVQMVLLAELCPFGPLTTTAQSLPGPAEERFQALARRHGIWLIPGSLYEKVDERIYNTASVISPDGTVVGRYRKMFPFFPYEKGVTPGSEFLVFDVPAIGRVGVSICYDMWFPETSRALAWMGAEVILHPTLNTTIDREVEVSMARATAAMKQCYVVDIKSCGRLGYGRSCIVSPEGVLLHEAGTGEEFIVMELDLAHVRRVRERGLFGLGQPLKSLRDCTAVFPQFDGAIRRSPAFHSLGPIEIPARRE